MSERDPQDEAILTKTTFLTDAAEGSGGFSGRSLSGFAQLDPEIRAVAVRRLKGAALVYGLGWIIMWLAGFVYREYVVHEPHDWFWTTRTIIAIVLSAAVMVAVHGNRISPSRFVGFAIAFEVMGSLLLASSDWCWNTVAATQIQELQQGNLDALRGGARFLANNGVHWSGVWLLLFPLIVPTSKREAAIGAFLAASAVPVVYLTSAWTHGIPDEVRPFLGGLYFWTFLSVYVVAAMAVFGAHVVYRLTRDLSKARELGSYRLIERIGAGGMGEVWRAQHRLLARPAAVKLIRPEALGEDETTRSLVQQRFEREAQATANLQSPHTVELYDFGIEDDGTFFYVMELLDGIDLQTLVQRFGPVPPERAVALLDQACHSLIDAHLHGLIHRDIKPANIFACRHAHETDFAKVLDFGLVTHRPGMDQKDPRLTAEGSVSGTPAFMAPEMAMGVGELDERADLYSLGCVGYWLLTGQFVFDGRSPMEILVSHAKEAPIPPSQRCEAPIPPEIDAVILSCLAKEPADRPSSARELAARLRSCRESLPTWDAERSARWWDQHLPKAM